MNLILPFKNINLSNVTFEERQTLHLCLIKAWTNFQANNKKTKRCFAIID